MLGQLASKRCTISSRQLLSHRCLQYRLLSSKSYNLASPANRYIEYKAGSWDSVQASGVSADELEVYPNFLNAKEQEILLGASLKKLESSSTLEERRRKREYLKANKTIANTGKNFLPDAAYSFQDRHFDGVISGYRETTLTDWPARVDENTQSVLQAILAKIYSLIPAASQAAIGNGLASPAHLITHLLHLSSEGYILPHVDNIQASAGTIAGVCLGTTRSLVLRKKAGEGGSTNVESNTNITVTLEPGCAYLQRGKIRYEWEHSIPLLDAQEEARGQRLSVMIRDRL